MTHLQSHISVHTVTTIITERPDKVPTLYFCQKVLQILLPMKEVKNNSILFTPENLWTRWSSLVGSRPSPMELHLGHWLVMIVLVSLGYSVVSLVNFWSTGYVIHQVLFVWFTHWYIQAHHSPCWKMVIIRHSLSSCKFFSFPTTIPLLSVRLHSRVGPGTMVIRTWFRETVVYVLRPCVKHSAVLAGHI